MRLRTDTKQPISFGEAYAQSETFRALFRQGMGLVEETAAYLDGDGRFASRALERPVAAVYARESMRLTTRLMQLASWLLLHRSVIEGDMTAAQAADEKRKIRLEPLGTQNADEEFFAQLPDRFADLINRSFSLQKQVEMIDAALLGDPAPRAASNENPVGAQIASLAAALGASF
ncbi:regulator of CtrA degradation [Faunimonas pinastri]|uniref:Regulator of CtrA degradation n=1 Tax=Faunimonas pinastri TaxID=1855383 RepID=A0A1H8Z5P9_9HYPH|nr:DUF1465 family protein [Faunimonas pinastri]SEP59716.1 regulator of CtrA degradation [Faunimonas pinastri]